MNCGSVVSSPWSRVGSRLKLRTTDHGLRTTDHGLRITDYGLGITDYGLLTTDHGLLTTDYSSTSTFLDLPSRPAIASPQASSFWLWLTFGRTDPNRSSDRHITWKPRTRNQK